MSSVGTGSLRIGEDGLADPPDPDIVETDPTGRYVRYKEILGRGAFKTVYKAFDEINGLEVAWNQVRINDVLQSNSDLERLYSEVHLLKSLRHNNIIRFYNSWIDDKNKTVNIITELFTSGSLRQYRKKHKNTDMKALKSWARQILVGLHYLHSHNPPIIHRDLKCDNIFVNGNQGEVKIGDLGLATVMEQANQITVVGTPEYMSPEVYAESYNELADIYSFGMCILELVTFDYPYSECQNSAQIFRKVSSGIKPASLSKVRDPEVKEFIRKCLAPASERLTAKELLLDHFLQVNGSTKNRPLPLPDIVMPKQKGIGDRCLMSEGPASERNRTPSMDMDDDGGPPVITAFYNSVNGRSESMHVEVRRAQRGKNFLLKGEGNDDSSVSLILRIGDQNGRVRNIHFLFYLLSDTACSVSREMAEQLGLEDQHIMFIAELIDLLLINLVPNWKPCVPIDHLVASKSIQFSLRHEKDSQSLEHEESLVEWIQNVSNSVNHPASQVFRTPRLTEGNTQTRHQISEFINHNESTCHGHDVQKPSIEDDQISEMSFFSAAFCDWIDEHCPLSSCTSYVSAESESEDLCGVEDIITGLEMEFPNDNKSKPEHEFHNELATPSSFHANDISSSNKEEDEELRMELAVIGVLYEEAIREISNRKDEAILETRKRVLQK